MSERRNAREADRSRQAIHYPRNPFMLAVTFGDYRRNRKNTRRLAGRETATFAENRHMAFEKSVGVSATGGNSIRPQAPADQFNRYVRYGAIQVRFACEQCGLLGVRILAYKPVHIKRSGDQSGYYASVCTAEYFIKLMEGRGISDM